MVKGQQLQNINLEKTKKEKEKAGSRRNQFSSMTCRRISLDAPTFKMFKICGAGHVTAILSECFYNFPICVSNSNRRGLLYRHILGPTSGEFPGPNPGKFGLYRLGFGPGMGTFIWHQKPHNHSRFCRRILTTD